jgi:hypothetical protein
MGPSSSLPKCLRCNDDNSQDNSDYSQCANLPVVLKIHHIDGNIENREL